MNYCAKYQLLHNLLTSEFESQKKPLIIFLRYLFYCSSILKFNSKSKAWQLFSNGPYTVSLVNLRSSKQFVFPKEKVKK